MLWLQGGTDQRPGRVQHVAFRLAVPVVGDETLLAQMSTTEMWRQHGRQAWSETTTTLVSRSPQPLTSPPISWSTSR